MKTVFLLALLAACFYYYFQNPAPPRSAVAETAAAQTVQKSLSAPAIVIAPAPSYAERWRTGPTAQTDLKTGPNAQVEFAPFAPSEQANWNQTPGYTIVSGVSLRR